MSTTFACEAPALRLAGVPAEQEDELFDIYSEDGTFLGTELRPVVHAKGIWHKAVYGFVFNTRNELLIQRRSPHKKVGPGQWDLSVAEHLQPKESYVDGVQRGMEEELGINVDKSMIAGPLAPEHKRKLDLPEINVFDYEFVQSFRIDEYKGPISHNPEEVTEVKWVTLQELQQDMQQHPDHYTRWFRDEIAALEWFGCGPTKERRSCTESASHS